MLLHVSGAHAQSARATGDDDEAPSTPRAPVAAPDLVRLEDGTMLRGTIAEMHDDGDVIIVTAAGETRTIAMSEVVYAGPADAAEARRGSRRSTRPHRAPPPAAPSAPAVRFVAPGQDLTFFVQDGASDFSGWGIAGSDVMHVTGSGRRWARICTAPCDVPLAPGTYRLAISRDGDALRPAEAPVHVAGPSRVVGHYDSYRGTRAAGWVVMGGSLLTGIAIAASAPKRETCYGDGYGCTSQADRSYRLVGGGVALGGILVGLLLALKQDEANVRVLPLDEASLAGGSLASSDTRPASFVPRGLAVRAEF